jgi:hypothetical protein
VQSDKFTKLLQDIQVLFLYVYPQHVLQLAWFVIPVQGIQLPLINVYPVQIELQEELFIVLHATHTSFLNPKVGHSEHSKLFVKLEHFKHEDPFHIYPLQLKQ